MAMLFVELIYLTSIDDFVSINLLSHSDTTLYYWYRNITLQWNCIAQLFNFSYEKNTWLDCDKSPTVALAVFLHLDSRMAQVVV